MTHSLSLLLLLSVFCHVEAQLGPDYVPTNLDPLPVLNVPIGAGMTPDGVKLSTEKFGMFGEQLTENNEFNTCGTKTVSSLNNNFKDSGGNVEIEVICEPSPDRIIVRADGNAFDFGTFERDLKKECELLTCSSDDYPSKDEEIGTLDIKAIYQKVDASGSPVVPEVIAVQEITDVKVSAGEPDKEEFSVCDTKKSGYSNGKTGSILFANEGQCFKTYTTLKGSLQNEKFIQIPRWLQSGEKVRNIRSAFYDGEHHHFFNRVPYGFQSTTSKESLQYKDCNTACDSGKVVKMIMKETQYKVSLSLDPESCTSFRICLAPKDFENDGVVPECVNEKIIDVQFINGIVMWPNMGRASLIELRSPYANPGRVVVVEFGYGTQIGTESRAEYYIGNDHREIVTSTSAGFKQADSRQLAFFFPSENCLKQSAGIYSKYVQSAKTLTSKDVISGTLFDDALIPLTAPQNEKPKTTTVIPIQNIIPTTTVSAPRALPGVAVLAESEKLFGSQEKQAAVYVAGKWWTWGIYLGFVIGTLLTLGIGGGIFYLLRRTVFSIWYRGMYKRYGCDPSATTAGLTGVGFGNTVTGDVTVQGTTGGTTVGGTTGGTSTMGGTTGGETSSIDKTGGPKSIAM